MSSFLKTGKKAMAVVLCVLLLLPFVFTTAFAAIFMDESLLYEGGRITEQKSYTITKGIDEKYIVLNNESNSNQIKNYAFEVDLSNEDLFILAGYNDGDADEWAMAGLDAQVEAMEKNRGVDVVAAVNAGCYNITTGEPADILIMDGKLIHQSVKQSFFAILYDGTAVIRRAGSRIDDVKEAVSGMSHLIENGKIVATDDVNTSPRCSVGIKKNGSVVFMVCDGRQSPDSCGMTYVQQANAMKALGCVDAIALDSGGSATIMTQRECMSEMQVRNNPCYGFVRPIASSLMICTSAKPTDEFDHITFDESEYKIYPGRSFSISMVACDVNGFKVDMPEGKLVLENTSYGRLVGSTFFAGMNTGTVNLNYVAEADGAVIATVPITVTTEAESFIVETTNTILRFFGNLIDMIKFVFQKLMSYLQ